MAVKKRARRSGKIERLADSIVRKLDRATQTLRLRKAAAAKKDAMKKTAKKSASKSKRKLNPALSRKMKPSAALAAVIGGGAVSRGEAVKKLWSYIKRHKLQVPSDMRSVKPDAKLAKVFGTPRAITMFMIAKKLSAHLS